MKYGRTEARETEPVLSVPDAFVNAALPYTSRQIRTMIDLQLITGMRPGEVCAMRGRDLDTTGQLWLYMPARHKTKHHGHQRTVYIGPRAQEVLRPFLKHELSAFLFSPADAEVERRKAVHARRKTPMSCGNKPGTNRTRTPRRAPGERYNVAAYRRAIARAWDLADEWAKGGVVIGDNERIIPRWHPHQLRHNAATRLRKNHARQGGAHDLNGSRIIGAICKSPPAS